MNNNNKIVKYISLHIPYSCCNFRCSYCYVRQFGDFNNIPVKLPSIEMIRKAFSVDRIGGKALFNFCAKGETLLHPEIVGIIRTILKMGHYVSVVTNGTVSKAFDELFEPGVKRDHIFIKFSFHYKELCDHRLLSVFVENVKKTRNSGGAFTVELVASDDNVPYIDEIKRFSLREFGAYPQLTIPRDDRKTGRDLITEYSLDKYKEIWSSFDSELFRFKISILYEKRREYCKAGNYSLQINLSTGNVMQCLSHPQIGNIFEKMDEPIEVKDVGANCCLPYCYNGHVYLTLGDIEDYDAPTYLDVRNRETIDGGEWFTEAMKSVFSQKLYDNNRV